MSRCMAEIHIERAHSLGKDAAWAAALKVAERMKEKAQVNYRVVGDTIEFERTGASGRIVVEAERIVAEIKLGLLLRPMRGVIESKVDEYFARYFQ
jgi:putative polyhydroxyalkanoate system protein